MDSHTLESIINPTKMPTSEYDITLTILDKDGNPVDGSFIFAELLKFDENGAEYAYTVTEEAVDGYTTKINGYDITNKLDEIPTIPPTTDPTTGPTTEPTTESTKRPSEVPSDPNVPQTGDDSNIYLWVTCMIISIIAISILIVNCRKSMYKAKYLK